MIIYNILINNNKQMNKILSINKKMKNFIIKIIFIMENKKYI